MPPQLLIHAIDQLQCPMRKSPAPFLRPNPYREEAACKVSLLSRLQVEHSTLQRINKVPSLIDKSLWRVRVPIEDEGVRMDFRRVIHDHERRLLLVAEKSNLE
jgi:hypothetical protein